MTTTQLLNNFTNTKEQLSVGFISDSEATQQMKDLLNQVIQSMSNEDNSTIYSLLLGLERKINNWIVFG